VIIDSLDRIGCYASLGENFDIAVRWMAETNLSTLPEGTTPVAGERVFATVSDLYLDREKPSYEAHHRYADIQLVLEGKEKFYLGWDGTEGEAVPGTDFYPCEAEHGLSFTLEANQFVIFLPGEKHGPGNSADHPGPCRKLVVKVLSVS